MQYNTARPSAVERTLGRVIVVVGRLFVLAVGLAVITPATASANVTDPVDYRRSFGAGIVVWSAEGVLLVSAASLEWQIGKRWILGPYLSGSFSNNDGRTSFPEQISGDTSISHSLCTYPECGSPVTFTGRSRSVGYGVTFGIGVPLSSKVRLIFGMQPVLNHMKTRNVAELQLDQVTDPFTGDTIEDDLSPVSEVKSIRTERGISVGGALLLAIESFFADRFSVRGTVTPVNYAYRKSRLRYEYLSLSGERRVQKSAESTHNISSSLQTSLELRFYF